MDDREYGIEREKLELDKKKMRWTSWSVTLPIIVAIGAIINGSCDLKNQRETQFQVNREQALAQFKIKAAEITLNAASPEEAIARANFLGDLFPAELAPLKNKANALKSSQYGHSGDPRWKDKMEFIKLLAANATPAARARIVAYWHCLAPDDDLLQKFRSPDNEGCKL